MGKFKMARNIKIPCWNNCTERFSAKKKPFLIVMLALFSLFLCINLVSGAWWDNYFTERRAINITGGDSDLTNFTVLLNISFDSNMQTNFQDIRFVNGSCSGVQDTELDYEFDEIISSTSALVWVRIPNLKVGSGNEHCMYYSNNAAGIGTNSKDTWEPSYTGVWHLTENSGTVFKDSLLLNNGTLTKGSGDFIGGRLGNAFEFDGSVSFVDTENTFGDLRTISFWLNASAQPNNMIMGQRFSATEQKGDWYFESFTATDNDYLSFAGSDGNISFIKSSERVLNNSNWHFVVLKSGESGLEIWIDNILNASNSGIQEVLGAESIENFTFGRGGGSGSYAFFDGTLDDILISNINRDSNWMNRTQQNSNFSNFIFGGLEFTLPPEGFIENSQLYNITTTQGSVENFEINISYNSSFYSNIQATLIYNSTSYTGTSAETGDDRIFGRTISVLEVLSETNVSFYWQIGLTNSTGIFYFNSTFKNQTISKVNIDNCTVYTNRIFNFSIVDEEGQDPVATNNSIKILVNIYNADKSIIVSNYSNSFNESFVGICMDTNLSVVSSSYIVDSTIKYSSQDHETEYYNIADYSLTNGSEVQNIILYDLLTSDSTEFQLTYTGSDFLAVEDALIFVKRQYVDENAFKTVELPKTDSNGQTILHLVRNDIVYNIEVMKDGVVIGSFENIIAFCDDVVIGDCKITLSSAESGDAIFNYDEALGITYTGPTYSSTTRIITFNFLTTDGSVKNILMNATRNDIFGNVSICSAFVSSSGGTLTCEVPSHIDDSTIITKVFIDGIEILKDYTVLSEFINGVAGYFIFFIFMLAFILMFSTSKSTMLIGILVGFICGISLGLVRGRIVGIGASGVWLVIVIVLMLWKLNKERPN